jgi:hypothetical protein
MTSAPWLRGSHSGCGDAPHIMYSIVRSFCGQQTHTTQQRTLHATHPSPQLRPRKHPHALSKCIAAIAHPLLSSRTSYARTHSLACCFATRMFCHHLCLLCDTTTHTHTTTHTPTHHHHARLASHPLEAASVSPHPHRTSSLDPHTVITTIVNIGRCRM